MSSDAKILVKECIELLVWPLLISVVLWPLKSEDVDNLALLLAVVCGYFALVLLSFLTYFLRKAPRSIASDSKIVSLPQFLRTYGLNVAQFLIVFYGISAFIKGAALFSVQNTLIYIFGYIISISVVFAGRKI